MAKASARDAGRMLVVRVVVIAMVLSIFSMGVSMLAQGAVRTPQHLTRLVLTVVLCAYLVRGAAWARWTSAVLFLVGGLLSVGSGFTLLGTPANAWLMIGFGGIYLYCAGVLMASPSVTAFFSRAQPT